MDNAVLAPLTKLTPVDTAAEAWITRVPIGKIRSDATYQRDLNEARVRRMAREFDVRLVGVLDVSLRDDGYYYTLDGQHRLEAARLAGACSTLMCRVFQGLAASDEAMLFLRLNTNRTGLNTGGKLKANVIADDPATLVMIETVESAGFSVSAKNRTYPHICAVGALQHIIRHGGTDILRQTLEIVDYAWGDLKSPESLTGKLLGAIALVLRTYRDDIDRKRLRERLRTVPPSRVERFTLNSTRGAEAMSINVALAILDLYNFKLQRKLDPMRLTPHRNMSPSE